MSINKTSRYIYTPHAYIGEVYPQGGGSNYMKVGKIRYPFLGTLNGNYWVYMIKVEKAFLLNKQRFRESDFQLDVYLTKESILIVPSS